MLRQLVKFSNTVNWSKNKSSNNIFVRRLVSSKYLGHAEVHLPFAIGPVFRQTYKLKKLNVQLGISRRIAMVC